MLSRSLCEIIRQALVLATGQPGDVLMTPIDGGIRIKRAGGHYIDVMEMAYNFRIVETVVDFPQVYDRYWCYVGKSLDVYVATVLAAAMWDGAPESEPPGWHKNGQTKEFRPGGSATVLPVPVTVEST